MSRYDPTRPFFSFLETDRGCYTLEGDLTLATAELALSKTARLFKKNKFLQFDLSGIVRGDSVGVGLLLEWRRQAHERGISIHYSHLPDQLKAMARVGGVAELLDISSSRS
jgi:phospholipid transport system transporter-binding protein